MKLKQIILAIFMMLLINVSSALTMEIVGGADNPIVISNVPFKWQAQAVQEQDLARIIDDDLKTSGYFDPVSRLQMMQRPAHAADINYANWRRLASEYLVIGRVSAQAAQLSVEYELYNVLNQEQVVAGVFKGPVTQYRQIAHRISDVIFEKITGIPGFFSGSILYVTSQRRAPGEFRYQLVKADADTRNPQVLLESSEPILSPNWSPNAQQIVYVSFEKNRPEIYMQSLKSGKRVRIAGYPGLNGSPAWSPDGKKIAFTLSKDGNPEIYVLDLLSKQLSRVTNNRYAIDTEPSWFPDSQTLLFTSDRGGQPQLYKVNIYNGQTSRVTFKGTYNARGRVFPNAKGIVMVHRDDKGYRIAVQDLQTGQLQVISDTSEDESPSVASNSNMIMYATKQRGRNTLAVVSVDGRTRYYLPAGSKKIREPAWSK